MWAKIAQWFGKWLNKAQAAEIKSSKSRSILLYLCFVFISAVLWCFLTFNNTITLDMQMPVRIVAKPDSVRLLGGVVDTVTVTVSNSGSSFVKYLFKETPPIELKFSDYADGEGNFKVDGSHLKKIVLRQLGRNSVVNSILPDNLNIKYTDGPGKLVPVVVDINVKPALQHMQNGPIIVSNEKVMVYANKATLDSITEVYTYHVKAEDLTDTLVRKVAIAPLRGAVVEPRTIELTVPIEKMTIQRQKLQVIVRNMPSDVKVIVFPSSVEASYRAPISALKRQSEVKAIVDYNEIVATKSRKIAVRAAEYPAIYQDIKLSVDSVEYIVEKQAKR